MYSIETIPLEDAADLCHAIIENLPQYFHMPGMNESYAPGMYPRINLAIKFDDLYVGLLGLEFPYPENAHIYWMGIMSNFHRKGLGTLLVQEAFKIALLKNAQTMSVETLSPLERDENYLKTYHFYKKCGFTPLFDLQAGSYQFMMVHMVKNLS